MTEKGAEGLWQLGAPRANQLLLLLSMAQGQREGQNLKQTLLALALWLGPHPSQPKLFCSSFWCFGVRVPSCWGYRRRSWQQLPVRARSPGAAEDSLLRGWAQQLGAPPRGPLTADNRSPLLLERLGRNLSEEMSAAGPGAAPGVITQRWALPLG